MGAMGFGKRHQQQTFAAPPAVARRPARPAPGVASPPISIDDESELIARPEWASGTFALLLFLMVAAISISAVVARQIVKERNAHEAAAEVRIDATAPAVEPAAELNPGAASAAKPAPSAP